MRRTPKSLACLVGVTGCLMSLFLVFGRPVVSKETETSSKVKESHKKRLAVLQTIHDLTKKGFTDGVIAYEQLRTAKADLLSARLDYAESKKDRITACDEAIADAKEWQKIVQQGAKGNAFSRFDELKAEADLLEAQITRENAEDDDE